MGSRIVRWAWIFLFGRVFVSVCFDLGGRSRCPLMAGSRTVAAIAGRRRGAIGGFS
jgi:hypothetical protein